MLDDDATPTPVDPAAPSDDQTPPAPSSSTAPPTSAAPDEPRFVPGTVLDGRYRIVGMLGRGGMGEVYRADDLKLGQSVALKFLPRGLDHDPELLQRFLGEVRVALRITHPNVCRVYDIGEVDGAHYLSMEYIDGEDLSSLLRRIGRLPEDKAVQIARQLCAGLAAAHEQGILHRDLKPANVMLDGRGDVRITDFGLAGLAEGFTGLEIRAGTPAFMAPEQLSGKEVTVHSDIYALGLVLYELFTGKRAFRGESLDEISRLQQSGPSSPTSHVSVLDPAVEQVILRCLEPEPANRPASVLKVALGLPGADPLAAALAAGETPSPEMVAEAGDDAGLAPRWAVALMVLSILGLLTVTWISGRYSLLGRVPMELPPQALVYRAQEIVESLGYNQPPVDQAYAFRSDRDLLRHLARDPSTDRWQRLSDERPTGIYMWYRQSPRNLVPQSVNGRVSFDDPPMRISGMVNLTLDSSGRLRSLRAVPPQHRPVEKPAPRPPPPEVSPEGVEESQPSESSWALAFQAAELDIDRFHSAVPEWIPESFCDQRAAWVGSYPGQAEPRIRVEACTFEGLLTHFSIVHPWTRAARQQRADQSTAQEVKIWIAGTVFVALMTGAALLVRRNLRLGRGDGKGALRLAAWTVVTALGGWFFQASHVAQFAEFAIFVISAGNILFIGALTWVLYIALEPFVRRRWPESLVSWNRLLAGRFRDPLVGRHMLYGVALGVGVNLVGQLGALAPTFFGEPGPAPVRADLDILLGTRWVLGDLFVALSQVIVNPMTVLFVLVLLRVVLGNSWLALAVFVALFTVLGWPEGDLVVFGIVANIIIWIAFGLFMMRFGLVAFISAAFISLLVAKPLTLDFTNWYAGHSLTLLAACVGFILAAFHISLGGRPLFPDDEG